MWMVSNEAMEEAMEVKRKLADPEKREECLGDIEHMIEVKQSHLWRAELGSCAGGLCGITGQVEIESGILQDAMEALKNSDDGKAASLLEDYIAFLKEHYEPERPGY
jgi:hypothetical protein